MFDGRLDGVYRFEFLFLNERKKSSIALSFFYRFKDLNSIHNMYFIYK